jgi:hypothetical protein
VTALGWLSVRRAYFTCAACGLGQYALDQRLGITGTLSRQARRVVCWAGGRMAFTQAAENLQEIGGWSVSDELIRQVCQAEAPVIDAWRATAEAASAGFRDAEGLPEFQTDAAKVNTETGWRDVKIGGQRSARSKQNGDVDVAYLGYHRATVDRLERSASLVARAPLNTLYTNPLVGLGYGDEGGMTMPSLVSSSQERSYGTGTNCGRRISRSRHSSRRSEERCDFITQACAFSKLVSGTSTREWARPILNAAIT